MNIEPSFDTWTSIFLVVALHGLILGALFFYRKEGRSLPNKLLGALLLLFSVNLVSNVLYWTRYNLELPHAIGIAGSFHFLYGPILLFYAIHILKPNRKWKFHDALHLVPAIIFLIWMLPFYFQPASEKIAMAVKYLDPGHEPEFLWRFITVPLAKISVLAGYAISLFVILRNGRNQIKSSNPSEETFRWLKVVNIAFWGYVISFSTYFILLWTIDFQVEYDYMIACAMSVFIFGIGYIGLIKPSYLEEAHNGRYKYETSSLDTDEAETHLENLLRYMDEEKPYLNGDLKMLELANQLAVPSHHLSQIINERLDKNFFEFVNSYRVKEAKKILADPNKRDFKILRVAFEAGFNNKTTFNNVFKREVGTTPSIFRKNQLNGHST